MQSLFGFSGHDDLIRWQRALAPLLDTVEMASRRSPIGQLIKSMISGRTRDAVSLDAYDRLVATFGTPGRTLAAGPDAVLGCIVEVTFPEDKVRHVAETLHAISTERRGFDLAFLGQMRLGQALAWLERLPGVGRKVAASTLNASTLDRPVFIVDTHVLRVLHRLSFVRPQADAKEASELVTAAMPEWRGPDFLNFHVVMKLVGQLWCRPDLPDCASCPLHGDCPRRER